MLLAVKPRLDFSQQRRAPLLAEGQPRIIVGVLRFALDGVELADQRQHLGAAQLVAVAGIVELPPRMRPAGDFRHLLRSIDSVVTAVGVGLQVTFVAR